MYPKTTITDEQLAVLEAEIREQYRERIDKKGTTPEGLFWDSQESMRTRFDIALESVAFEGCDVLDIGCGFGDFYRHLKRSGVEISSYTGIDVSEVVLKEAKQRFGDEQVATFQQRNILLDPYDISEFDVAVVFGALGHNLESIDNEAYIRRFMRTCYAVADTVVLNALSSHRQGDWPYEDFVYYYNPEKVFGYAQELTRDVILRHDFDPIPQKEFLIVLKDDGRGKQPADPSVADLDT